MRPNGDKWRVCRSIFVAASDEEARARVYSPESGYRHFFGHMHKVYSQLGRLGVLKPRPEKRDDEVTVDTFIEQRAIFGSPKTVLAELIDLRRDGRPVRHPAVDRGRLGRSECGLGAQILRRLAQDVLPALRQETAAA